MTTEREVAMPRGAPLKFKILRTRWKDERGVVVEGARISATRLNADELQQLAHEILRAAADCRTDGFAPPCPPESGGLA
jgi:hypothetical protein